MPPVTRLSLAQQAYLTALRAASARSTPQTWARLLTAARNLRDARSSESGQTTGGYRHKGYRPRE